MKINDKLKTFFIASLILLAFGIFSSIIILITSDGSFKTKDILTFSITGTVLVLDIVILIFLLIKRKAKDGDNNNQ